MREILDQKERDSILLDNKSILVSASAGSGKTTIMVEKMSVVLNISEDHKTIGAVTFTQKAAQGIKDKAKGLINEPFVAMTNDGFIEKEVIRPFIKDALGSEYNKDYQVEYDNDYKFNKYSDGLNQLLKRNILGKYRDNRKNFTFKLGLNILKNSIAAREYLKSKYAMIFIDEYQDCDLDMHNFFMELKNQLNIKLFIVGDPKQAIYVWRGAMRDIFDLLVNEGFSPYKLVTNFRCHPDIENYANLIHHKENFRVPKDCEGRVVLKKCHETGFSEIVNDIVNLIENKTVDINKEITLILNYNDDAQLVTQLINEAGLNFVFIPKTPIDEGIPNGNLLKELANYTKNFSYSIYDFLENNHIDERRSTQIEIENIIKDFKTEELVKDLVTEKLFLLSEYLGINISDDEVEKFFLSISETKYANAFRLKEEKYKVMTVFASKGLEFDQVISLSRYYSIHNGEQLENHYVCVTRAREKFVMLVDVLNYAYYVNSQAKSQVRDLKTLVELHS